MYTSPYAERQSEARRGDIAAAFENFEADMIGALLHDLDRMLPTPAWSPAPGKYTREQRVPELVSSLMDRDLIRPLLEVLQGAAKGKDVRADALKYISELAHAYADCHAEAA